MNATLTEVLTPTRSERWLGLFARLRPGEGRSVFYFMTYGFLVMFSYYMLKTLRETLLLSKATAETKSYAYAVIAIVLLFVVPAYSAIYYRVPNRQISIWITILLIAVQTVFFLLTYTGLNIGFAYYVWVGIFGVFITAQFWAYAADTFNVKTGQRVFPLIMIGVSLGGLIGPGLAGSLLQILGTRELMVIILLFLALMLPMIKISRKAVPELSRCFQPAAAPEGGSVLDGFGLVLHNRYLLLIAVLIVLLNWVNTTGEYLLAELVVRHAESLIAEDPSLDKGRIIGGFYGSFFTVVNALSLLLQMFLVSRIIRWIGIRGALLILPVIALAGYGLMVFVPIFSIISVVKVIENSTDYSIMNTSRQALFLPLTAAEKYQSKITIDAFFWRFGDLIQAGAVYVGLNLLDFETKQFAILNMALAMIWLGLAAAIGRRFVGLKKLVTTGEPPTLVQSLQPQPLGIGVPLDFTLPANLFMCEPGDILDIAVRPVDGGKMPEWLEFDRHSLRIRGTPPENIEENIWLTIRATNIDGQWTETRLGFVR